MEHQNSSAQPLPYAAEAAGLSLIRVTGEDARHFLHGQFTQKIEGLGDRVTLAGYCSPKGRLLAALRVWEDGDAVMLLLPASMAEGFLKRIRMFVLRAKVTFEEIAPVPRAVMLMGRPGENALAEMGLAAPEAGKVIRADGFTLLGLEPASRIPGFCTGGSRTLVLLPQGKTPADLPFTAAPAAWAVASSIAAGIAQILPPARDLFVPQAVNFELAGGVSFTKGCYPGQEVISRVQHIGEIKRRAAIGRIPCEATAAPGAPVYSQGEEAGAIIRAVTLCGETLVLFSAALSAMPEGISLTPEGDPLEIAELPYRYRNVLNDPA